MFALNAHCTTWKLIGLLGLVGLLTACAGRGDGPSGREDADRDFPGRDSVLAILQEAGYPEADVEQRFLRNLAVPGLLVRFEPADPETSREEVQAVMDALTPLIRTRDLGAVVFQLIDDDDEVEDTRRNRAPRFDHGYYRDSLHQWSYLGSDPARYFQRRLREVEAQDEPDLMVLLHLHTMRGGIALYQNFPVLARHHLGEASRLLSDADDADVPDWLALMATRYRLHLSLSTDDEALFSEVLPHYAQVVQNTPGDPKDMMPIVRVQPAPIEATTTNRRRVGYALFEFTVTANGRVRNIELIESNLGWQFRDAAERALRGFAYEPRIEDGLPVDTPGVRYRFEFSASR